MSHLRSVHLRNIKGGDPDASAWNTRITAAGGAGDLADLQDYVATTKAAGVWDKHVLMLHGWNVANANLVRSNGSTVATYEGTLTHSSNTMTTNGTNNALKTGLVPSVTGWMGQFFYKTSTTASSPGVDFGAATTSPSAVILNAVNLSGTAYADYCNSTSAPTGGRITTTGQTAAGLYSMWTPDNSTQRFARTTSGGTTSLSTGSIGGTTDKPTAELTLGAYNVAGLLQNWCAGSYCASGIMTASLTSTERDDLIAAIITLLLARGWIT